MIRPLFLRRLAPSKQSPFILYRHSQRSHLTPLTSLTPLNRASHSTQKPTSSSTSPASESQNPSLGGASFKELGANRTVKTVVLVFFSIIATVESIGWFKFLGIGEKFSSTRVAKEGNEGKEGRED